MQEGVFWIAFRGAIPLTVVRVSPSCAAVPLPIFFNSFFLKAAFGKEALDDVINEFLLFHNYFCRSNASCSNQVSAERSLRWNLSFSE